MTAIRRLRNLFRAEEGSALVELAVILPVLMLIFLGTVEVGRFVLLNLKLGYLANSMSDLITRTDVLTQIDIDNALAAAPVISSPFPMATNGRVILSAVGIANPADVNPSVMWQRAGAGALVASSTVGVEGGAATLPPGLTVAESQIVIVSEIYFSYEPLMVPIVEPTTLRKVAIYRPRLGGLRAITVP